MRVYIGIDWSEKKHDVVYQDETGRQLLRLTIPHSLEGFLELDRARQQWQVRPEAVVVGIVEAKAEGGTLSRVAEQAADYAVRLPPNIPQVSRSLAVVIVCGADGAR